MWPNPQETAYLVTSTEEILNGKLYFLWSVSFFFSDHLKIKQGAITFVLLPKILFQRRGSPNNISNLVILGYFL